MGNKILIRFNIFGPYFNRNEIPHLIKGWGLDPGQKEIKR